MATNDKKTSSFNLTKSRDVNIVGTVSREVGFPNSMYFPFFINKAIAMMYGTKTLSATYSMGPLSMTL